MGGGSGNGAAFEPETTDAQAQRHPHPAALDRVAAREREHPAAARHGTAGTRVTKAVTALTNAGLIEERETTDPDAVSRSDGDLRFGLFITPAGLQAIGVEEVGAGAPQQPDVATGAPERPTKAAAVLALLGRDEGASLAELIAATGWLPHTTRAALTGLRKKGHSIVRFKRDGATCYRAELAA